MSIEPEDEGEWKEIEPYWECQECGNQPDWDIVHDFYTKGKKPRLCKECGSEAVVPVGL